MKYILVLITALLGACNPPANPDAPPFRAAVEAYLAAVAARDMEALLPTLTGKDTLILFTAGGGQFDTRRHYIDFQRDWFAGHSGGMIETEIADATEGSAFGHALVRYRYNWRDAAGVTQSRETWSILTFDLENNSWRLGARSDSLDDPRKKAKVRH
jgi:ketosteroid isomerase-like protein